MKKLCIVIIACIFAGVVVVLLLLNWLTQSKSDVFDNWYEKGSDINVDGVMYHV